MIIQNARRNLAVLVFANTLAIVFGMTERMDREPDTQGSYRRDSRVTALLELGLVTGGSVAVSLKETSQRLQLSQRYLGQIFKRETGIRFREYLRAIRMIHLVEMLEDPSTDLKDVARRTGYADASAFHREFRKVFGVTPGEYRSGIMNKSAPPAARDSIHIFSIAAAE